MSETTPYDEATERAVLAAILLEPELIGRMPGGLRSDFYEARHISIYEAMEALGKDGAPIDLRTLRAKLEDWGRLDAIGGVAYLSGLDLDLPDIGRIDAYVEIVQDRATRRRLLELGQDMRRNATAALPIGEILGNVRRKLLDLEKGKGGKSVVLSTAMERTLGRIEKIAEQGSPGVPTGFRDLDRHTGGLNPGWLILVAGRPGMGKTSFAIDLLRHVAIRVGRPAVMFSIEMTTDEVTQKIIAAEAITSLRSVRMAEMSIPEWKGVISTMRRAGDAPLYIDDGSRSMDEIATECRRIQGAHGDLGLVVIDYLQLSARDDSTGAMTDISRAAKRLAKDLSVPVVALSQLNRDPEKRDTRRPELSDLRQSGSLEQDADLVLFPFREEHYFPSPTNRGMAELIVAKFRHGSTGSVRLAWVAEITSFRGLEEAG